MRGILAYEEAFLNSYRAPATKPTPKVVVLGGKTT
ncbi:MAG: hypothetical protein ACD_61C00006G0002, partial [uncultured bacterium]